MSKKQKIAVIGLGAYGSAVSYHLARQGAEVVGIDRYVPPHAYGSTHGETRITRFAVMEGAEYVRASIRAAEIFNALQRDKGETLFVSNGFVLIGKDQNYDFITHGQTNPLGQTIALARQFGIAHDILDTAEIKKRFPAFSPSEGEYAYFEAESGTLYPEACVRAQLEEAVRLGATLRTGEIVRGILQTGDSVTIATATDTIKVDRAVIAAGPWIHDFLPEEFRRKFKVTRQVLHWLGHDNPEAFSITNHPNYIWMHDNDGKSGDFYGFPAQPGASSVKMATEFDGEAVTPDSCNRSVGDDEQASMFNDHARGRILGLSGEVLESKTCMYTSTPTAKFIIAPHPDMNRVTVISACSGHGFKASTALAEALACNIMGTKQTHTDLENFGWSSAKLTNG